MLIRLSAKHECAASNLAANETALTHKSVSTSNCTNCNPDVVREIALRGQFRARRQNTLGYIAFNTVCQPQIKRAGAFG